MSSIHLSSSVELIDERTSFTLIELCQSCVVEAEFIEALVEHGILEPIGKKGHHWCFSYDSLKRTRIVLNLKKDLGVNLEGAALALELLDRIDYLNEKLRLKSG